MRTETRVPPATAPGRAKELRHPLIQRPGRAGRPRTPLIQRPVEPKIPRTHAPKIQTRLSSRQGPFEVLQPYPENESDRLNGFPSPSRRTSLL